jgi:microcystin degradation protein MlrC
MRIALGAFSHEANTFCPLPTGWDQFSARSLQRGEEVLTGLTGTFTEISGACGVLQAQPEVTVVPLLAARALSGAPVAGEVYQAILDELLTRLREALPVQGVLLVLHGAMMAEGEPDATGAILQRVREVVGPQVPIMGTLDLHANVTARMVRWANALVGYHTAPHIDMFQAGQTAARLLLGTLRGEIRPKMALVRLPLLVPAENARHTDGPLSEVIGMALEMERRGDLLHGGVYAVQPWMDAPDVGCATVAITNGDAVLAERCARELATAFWARRGAFVPELTPPDVVLRRALARESGLTVVSDSADAPSSGATGDSTVLLDAALRASPLARVALLNVVDAPAVAAAIAAGVGANVTLPVGGRIAPRFFRPVTFRGRVKIISDGEFFHKGPGMRGVRQQMGRAVVLVQGGIHLVVMEHSVTQWDPQLYRSLGLEPSDAALVQVKSPAAFRAAYGPLAAETLIMEAPGAASPHLLSLPWQHLGRPLYPLDPDLQWP